METNKSAATGMEKLEVGRMVSNAVVSVRRGEFGKSVLSERSNKKETNAMLPPNPLKVPPNKMSGFPEKYKSPTDSLVSPVSKGLLARNRRPSRLLAPPVPPKALESTFQNIENVNVPSDIRMISTYLTSE